MKFLLISERVFEDHEYLEEPLSTWGHNSQNKIYFVSKPQKYVMFTEPQVSSVPLTNVRVPDYSPN